MKPSKLRRRDGHGLLMFICILLFAGAMVAAVVSIPEPPQHTYHQHYECPYG